MKMLNTNIPINIHLWIYNTSTFSNSLTNLLTNVSEKENRKKENEKREKFSTHT